jgi:hypothetical protein
VATRSHLRFQLEGEGGNEIALVRWTGLLQTDDGEWIRFPKGDDRSVHVFGTFGAGGNIVLEGSNEDVPTPSNAVTLDDTRGMGNSLTFNAKDIRQVLQSSVWVRPRVTSGDGTTSLTLFLRATKH